jgi:Tfp pilus assembly protein PilF
LQRAQVYLHDRQWNEAQNDLESIVRFEPSSAEAHYFLAMLYNARSASVPLKRELGEALRLDPQWLPARVEMANLLLNSNDAKAALGTLEEAPESQKHTLEWMTVHNWALIGTGDRAGARKEVDRLLAIRKTAEGITQKGVLKLVAGDFAGARADFEEVLKADPRDIRTLGLLAQSYGLQKQTSEGTKKLRPYVEQQKDSPAAQLLWANWLLGTGDTVGARRALIAAKAASPTDLVVDEELARLDAREGKIDDAQQRLTSLLEADPKNVKARILLGTLLAQANRRPLAVEQFRKALDVDESNLAALNNLAFLLAYEPAQLDEALKYAQRAKELAPQDSYVRDTLGWVYFRKGLYSMAAKELEGALASGVRPSVKFHLGVTYLKMGNAKGQELISAALQSEPKLAQTESWK